MTHQAPETRDYFTDLSVLLDPYDYFANVFAEGPVHQIPGRDYLIVTGFEESVEVLRNTKDFSSAFTTLGSGAPLPFVPQGDDISEQIEEHRNPNELMVTYDGAHHTATRSILNRLFAPTRLRENEAAMTEFADELVRDAVARGGCDLVKEIATPFVTFVIANLLGVPADDRKRFMAVIAASNPPGNMNEDDPDRVHPLQYMSGFFAKYVQDRRESPREDVLNELAAAKYPDGSTPEAVEIVKLAIFLFAAGQDTSAKLVGNSMRFICDTPGLQKEIRGNRELIPSLIEEVLRLEGSTKATFRLAKRNTTIGGVDVPAGTKVMVGLAGANRDPRKWENPDEFVMDRPGIREHLAFGRGSHTCAGAPLARAEVNVLLNRFLEHTSHIEISEAEHGPLGNRRLEYEPSFIIRGLEHLHLVLTP